MLATDICDCWAWMLSSETAEADETAASDVAATEACDCTLWSDCIEALEMAPIEANEREAWMLRSEAAEAAETEETDACD